MVQKIILADYDFVNLTDYLLIMDCKRILLVHGQSMNRLDIGKYLLSLHKKYGICLLEFTDFSPNPDIESAIIGAKICRRENCDMIIACGGGSAIDVAKCIRLFVEADMDKVDSIHHLQPGKLRLMAIPTTAGTGSEATHFAVVYKNKQKLSISEKENIPQAVVFDARTLAQLPLKQKKATYFDALCHAIESLWSIHATVESRIYATEAIKLLVAAENIYLSDINNEAVNMNMLIASHYAGKAINISKTTAAHAMSYKLTELLDIPHGHSAAVCLNSLLPHMLETCAEKNEIELLTIMNEINNLLGGNKSTNLASTFEKMLDKYKMFIKRPADNGEQILSELVNSVNEDRLKNHPHKLTKQDFYTCYNRILNK